MAIGWLIKVDVTGDGYKDSVRGYAVAIGNRDEAMAAARENFRRARCRDRGRDDAGDL
jgi:hypothetical protein